MMLRHQLGGSRPPLSAHLSSDRSSASDSSIGSVDHIIENIYYGDFIGPQLPTIQKSPNTFRGVSCQLGGLPSDPTGPMHEDLVDSILRHNVDVIALQEVGINFSYAGVNGDWQSRLGWNTLLDGHTTRTVNAWNSNDHHKQTQQWGGTAVITRGETSFHHAGSGRDPSNLGRWCWTRYQGKNNCFLRVISFYRPCSRHNPGELSVTAQHTHYLHTQDDERHPRLAFMEDLNAALQEWITMGDQIIVCGDINENILSNYITTFFANLGLRHLIFSKHDSASAPSTYYRNQQGESVDGIWASPTLDLIRGGYLEKGDFPGDHRPIWFEISYAQAFGGTLPPIWKPQARRLQLRDPKCVQRYNTKLKQLLISKRLPQRQHTLELAITTHMTPAQLTESIAIDDIYKNCMDKAERHCRHLKMGEVQFSDITLLPRYQVHFWQLTILRRKGQHVRTRQWKRAKTKAKINEATKDIQLPDLFLRLKAAYIAYKAARKTHASSRLKFMDNFEPKHRNRLLRVEEQRRQAKVSRQINNKCQNGSVTKIQRAIQVNNEETLVECTTQEDICNVLLEVNEMKYQQCDASPFLQEPLLADFGFTGNTANSEAVLNGTYIPPPTTDPYTRLFLQHMQIPLGTPPPNPSSSKVSTADHQLSWKRAKEYTTSGISGIHFGRFKAQATDPDLASFDASRRSIHYSTGTALPRWYKGVDVMLLKASGDTRAHKLRTILLMEADFNMNNKKLSREGMWHAETHNCIAPEQAGGRRCHRANETSLNSALVCDDSRFRRKAMAICSNDAKGCFDRIVHSVAYICLRRFGIPAAPILSMLNVIQNMTHSIRTAFGDSSDTYGPSLPPLTPYMGLLQGNGAAGTGWTAVVTPIINAMKSLGFGYKIRSSISRSMLEILCVAFVDDTDLFHSGHSNYTSGAEVALQMQSVLDHWDNLIRVTGGALEKSKSYWYLLDYTYRQGKWTYKPTHSVPGQISLFNDETQAKEPIERLSPSSARKALGILTCPTGDMAAEVAYLVKKTKTWAASIQARRIRTHDAWYCLTATIMKTVEYPLVATTLTKKQCRTIMTPLLQAGLHAIHVQRNMPLVLVYGPTKFQGLGIQDPWATQLIEHIQVILRHCTRPTPTGTLLRSNMENLVLELGSATSFWQLNYHDWKMLATDSWITRTWKDLHDSPLTLKGPLIATPAQRHQDQFLMDIFMTRNLTPAQLTSLNNTRMYKQVIRTSDISSADGFSILPTTFTNSPPTHPTPFEWPRCSRPTDNDITLWIDTIRSCFIPPHATHRRLTIPLGLFYHSESPYWLWWYSAALDLLYYSVDSEWTIWQPSGQLRKFRQSPLIVTELPPDAVRATTDHRVPDQIARLVSTGLAEPPPLLPPSITLQDHIQALPPGLRWAIDYATAPAGTATIAQAIILCQCYAVTDASLKDLKGSAAFILVGLTDIGHITGVNTVPGPLKIGDSYRCELSGIFGIIILVNIVCIIHNITEGSIHVRCDNASSLLVFDPWFVPDPSNQSFDIINAIWHLLKNSPLKWTAEWVKGHADKLNRPMDRWETLNCKMDALADTYRVTITPNAPTPHQHIEHEGWSVWSDDVKLASPNRKTLYEYIYAPIIIRHWTSPHQLTPEPRFLPTTAPMIDWNATQSFMAALPTSKQRWCTKNASENCGVGSTLLHWNKQLDEECPRCQAPENTTHVLRCTAHDASTVWDTNITKVNTVMTDLDTPIQLQEALITRLQDWRNDSALIPNPLWDPAISTLIQAQDTIGWKNLLEGLPSRLWTLHMAHHYTSIGSSLCPARWLLKVQLALHQLAWSQWEHRNHILHDDAKPRNRRAIVLLNQAISREYHIGTDDLPPSDHYHFHPSLLQALNHSTSHKQAWYINVTNARQRQDRRVLSQGLERDESIPDPRLLHWIRTGRLR